MACKTITWKTGAGPAYGSLCVSKDSSDVHVSITAEKEWATRLAIDKMWWTMRLRRKQSDGSWVTVGTREGYVTPESPSHRTFTNVGQIGSQMQVYVNFWGNSSRTGGINTFQIVSFTR